MTDTFNPYSATSTGGPGGVTAEGLYNEPLFIWNILKPSEPPYHILGTGYSWSNGGKTLTITTRSGVKWNDGKPFSASDVAFTFNMIRTNPGLDTNGTPVPVSATAPNATTAVLNFSAPEYANLFLIGQVYIVPQHIWSMVNPVTFADPNPVGTGPYMLDKFSTQGFTLKENPHYWDKSAIRVPEIDYPAYTANFNIVDPLATGQIDLAGNDIADVQSVYLAKSPDNHTWFSGAPYLTANNVVTLFFNVTKAPLNDPAVRQAISYGIDRQQLSAQGETGYELPETSTSGLLLPRDSSWLNPALANNLPRRATRPRSRPFSRPTAGARSAASGPRTARRSASRSPTRSPTPTTTSTPSSIAKQLNAARVQRHGERHRHADVWHSDVTYGHFDTAIHWSNQGPTPYQIYEGNLDATLTAPVGKPAATNIGRWDNAATQSALAQFAGSNDPSVQKAAVTSLENIMTTQVPVAPLLYGAAWWEFSTRDYTGWPSASNPFMNPSTNSPYPEETVLHLKPVS